MGCDAHSASWLSIIEVIKAFDNLSKVKGADTSELKTIVGMMLSLKEARLVFWFDN